MALTWADSYFGQLRLLAGDSPVLIIVGAGCVLRDEQGRLLLIQRSDNGAWALPAGAMELGESLPECAIREVREETGLVAEAITPFALYSAPHNRGANVYGHTYQGITLVCRVDAYHGELVRTTPETIDAAYYPSDALPDGTSHTVRRALQDLATFEATGQFVLG